MTSKAEKLHFSGMTGDKSASQNAPPIDASLSETPLRGVLYGTQSARLKNKEHFFYLFAKNIPAIAAIVWIATRPTGFVEWSAFAAFYVMSILSMSLGYHRFFMHRAFETSKRMRYAIVKYKKNKRLFS